MSEDGLRNSNIGPRPLTADATLLRGGTRAASEAGGGVASATKMSNEWYVPEHDETEKDVTPDITCDVQPSAASGACSSAGSAASAAGSGGAGGGAGGGADDGRVNASCPIAGGSAKLVFGPEAEKNADEYWGGSYPPAAFTLTPTQRLEMADYLATQVSVIPMGWALESIMASIEKGMVLQVVTSNEDGLLGPHGRFRTEGFEPEVSILLKFWTFIMLFQKGAKFMKTASFFLYWGHSLIARTMALIAQILAAGLAEGADEASTNCFNKKTALLAKLEKNKDKKQSIRAHADFPGSKRMLKAVFMTTSNQEPSYWDIYYGDAQGMTGVGQHIATLEMPSGSCLFVSDVALGMLLARIGGQTGRFRHAVRGPSDEVSRNAMQLKLEGEYNQVV